mmetsp:Transcript_116894/g.206920  ORF Transcript_116894/g.206920 Transcript_116894/m.206920 type:complete len:204 (+) Transcript_116894:96-707(+)
MQLLQKSSVCLFELLVSLEFALHCSLRSPRQRLKCWRMGHDSSIQFADCLQAPEVLLGAEATTLLIEEFHQDAALLFELRWDMTSLAQAQSCPVQLLKTTPLALKLLAALQSFRGELAVEVACLSMLSTQLIQLLVLSPELACHSLCFRPETCEAPLVHPGAACELRCFVSPSPKLANLLQDLGCQCRCWHGASGAARAPWRG